MSKKKVFCVDDEPEIVNLIKLQLEGTGDFEVATTTNPSTALTQIKEFNPDLVILDFMIKNMTGSDIAEQLQQDSKTKNTPFIFLTGITSQEDIDRQGNVVGGQFFLAKPIVAEKLIEAVKSNLKS